MKTIRETEHIKVTVKDNEYLISASSDKILRVSRVGFIQFQKGPIKESGVNGCQIEDLLAICIHRLEGFADGGWVEKENALAIKCIQDGLAWLDLRTKDRKKRGVEGTNKK